METNQTENTARVLAECIETLQSALTKLDGHSVSQRQIISAAPTSSFDYGEQQTAVLEITQSLAALPACFLAQRNKIASCLVKLSSPRADSAPILRNILEWTSPTSACSARSEMLMLAMSCAMARRPNELTEDAASWHSPKRSWIAAAPAEASETDGNGDAEAVHAALRNRASALRKRSRFCTSTLAKPLLESIAGGAFGFADRLRFLLQLSEWSSQNDKAIKQIEDELSSGSDEESELNLSYQLATSYPEGWTPECSPERVPCLSKKGVSKFVKTHLRQCIAASEEFERECSEIRKRAKAKGNAAGSDLLAVTSEVSKDFREAFLKFVDSVAFALGRDVHPDLASIRRHVEYAIKMAEELPHLKALWMPCNNPTSERGRLLKLHKKFDTTLAERKKVLDEYFAEQLELAERFKIMSDCYNSTNPSEILSDDDDGDAQSEDEGKPDAFPN